MRVFRDDAGFSLIETLVATFIFALVSASGVALLSGYQDGRLMLSVADERLAALEATRATLRADLLAAVERTPRDKFGAPGSPFDGGDRLPSGNMLEFVRNGNMGALMAGNVSALEHVAYLVVDGNLVRRSYARTDLTPDTPATDRVLLSGVKAVALRFDTNGTWVPEWRGAFIGGMPRLADIQITFDTGRTVNQTFLIGGGA